MASKDLSTKPAARTFFPITAHSQSFTLAVLSHHSTRAPHSRIAIIGGGPAGLRAAEIAAAAGLQVTLYDAKPSTGRKFLVAGKGGLNLTHGEPIEHFATRYLGPNIPPGFWGNLLAEFSPSDLRAWAAGLGSETFQATSGRVYPTALKAAPLLRRWIERLRSLGVCLEMNYKLTTLTPGSPYQLGFENGNSATADAVILALGGGSWARTGSDGEWLQICAALGLAHHSLTPANCGWEHAWSPEVLVAAEGQPLKNLHVRAEETVAIGELIVTRYGLEGGPIYQLGSVLRAMPQPAISIDFKPTFTEAQLIAKLGPAKRNLLEIARQAWKLSPAVHAILATHPGPDVASLAHLVKNFPVPLRGPRPLDEAISSAGGLCWSEVSPSLMVTKFPGLFAAGEMLDWEAPTGGYLLQGCLATATRAARSAVIWLEKRTTQAPSMS